MKLYQIVEAGKILEVQAESEESALIKVRVTHVMPTYADACIYTGMVNRKYPFVCGHIGIGIISDDRLEYGLKRGTKVIINPYTVDNIDRFDMPRKVSKMGINSDGLMRDLIYLPIENITPFPEEVKEEEAIFTEKIAIAIATIDRLNVEKGDYLAIVGGSDVCNIIAQLALYYQMIPIMIDTNSKFLEKAKDCGVYYTIDSTKDVPTEQVKEITGGRMAEHTVVELNHDATGAFIFKLNREGGNCILLNEGTIAKELDADVSAISKYQLKVTGVSNGAQSFDTAINALAQHILNLNGFIDKVVPVSQAGELLKEMSASNDEYYSPIIKL